MNKKGSSWLVGFILVILGLSISIGGFYFSCVSPNEGSGTQEIATCLLSLNTFLLLVIGGILGTIGAFICRDSIK